MKIELKNGTACKEEILELVCESDFEVLVIHQAVFNGQDTAGCGFLMPINISSLLSSAAPDLNQKNLTEEDEARLFSVQSTVNRRYVLINLLSMKA